MSDEAPLIELIVNADPGVNYQWKAAAAQAQGAHTALPVTALWCFQTMGKEGEKGQELNGILRSSCNTTSHCWKPPEYPGCVQEVLWMQK